MQKIYKAFALFFSLFAFLLTLSKGLSNSIEYSVIIYRCIMSIILFAGIGWVCGFLLVQILGKFFIPEEKLPVENGSNVQIDLVQGENDLLDYNENIQDSIKE